MQNNNEPISTVFVVDDDSAIRESVRMLVKSIGFSVECYSSADEFFNFCKHTTPGCIVLDVRMPGMSGTALQEKLVASSDLRPIIFITGHGDVPMSVQSIKNGAVDFLEKPYSPQKLVSSIRAAMDLAKVRFQEHLAQVELEEQLGNLTPPEREVMEQIVAGKINKTIAADLDVSLRTVEYRKASLMKNFEWKPRGIIKLVRK